jgi:hypothetical protein
LGLDRLGEPRLVRGEDEDEDEEDEAVFRG